MLVSHFPSSSYHRNELVTTVTVLLYPSRDFHLLTQVKTNTSICMYFGKRPWCWGRLKAKGEGRQMRWLGNVTDSMNMSLSKLWETVEDREARSVYCDLRNFRVGYLQLSDWTAKMLFFSLFPPFNTIVNLTIHIVLTLADFSNENLLWGLNENFIWNRFLKWLVKYETNLV